MSLQFIYEVTTLIKLQENYKRRPPYLRRNIRKSLQFLTMGSSPSKSSLSNPAAREGREAREDGGIAERSIKRRKLDAANRQTISPANFYGSSRPRFVEHLRPDFHKALRIDILKINADEKESEDIDLPAPIVIRCKVFVALFHANSEEVENGIFDRKDYEVGARKIANAEMTVFKGEDGKIKRDISVQPIIFSSRELMVNRKKDLELQPDPNGYEIVDLADRYRVQVIIKRDGGHVNWPPLQPTTWDSKSGISADYAEQYFKDFSLDANIPLRLGSVDQIRKARISLVHKSKKQLVPYSLQIQPMWSKPSTLRAAPPSVSRPVSVEQPRSRPVSVDPSLPNETNDDTHQATSHDNIERSRRARSAVSTYNIKTLSAQAQGKSPRKRKAREIVGNEDDDENSGMTVTFTFKPADAAENQSKNQHIYVNGLRCAFCDRNHASLDDLRFHLNHDHENFKFSLRRQSPDRISFFVEVLKSRSHLDGRIFQLGKCAKPFDLETYLSGDRSWVKTREGPYHNHWPDHLAVGTESGFRPLGPQSSLEPSPQGSEESSPNTSSRSSPKVLDAVGKSRRKILVPKTAKPLYHTITKRRLQPGEELPDSDDEKDESWFQQKRRDMINDFEDSDIDPSEKEYLNIWNRFASKSHTIDVLLPDTVDAFVETHKNWLTHRTQKFMAHMGVLVLQGVVKEKSVSKWRQVIQKAKDEGSDLPDEAVDADPPQIKYRGMADCICLEHAPLHDRVVCVGEACQGRMFHQECALKPGVPSAPRGRWMCDKCIEQGAESVLAWP